MLESKIDLMYKARNDWVETASKFAFSLWKGGYDCEEIAEIMDISNIPVWELTDIAKNKPTKS